MISVAKLSHSGLSILKQFFFFSSDFILGKETFKKKKKKRVQVQLEWEGNSLRV